MKFCRHIKSSQKGILCATLFLPNCDEEEERQFDVFCFKCIRLKNFLFLYKTTKVFFTNLKSTIDNSYFKKYYRATTSSVLKRPFKAIYHKIWFQIWNFKIEDAIQLHPPPPLSQKILNKSGHFLLVE